MFIFDRNSVGQGPRRGLVERRPMACVGGAGLGDGNILVPPERSQFSDLVKCRLAGTLFYGGLNPPPLKGGY